MTPDLLLIFLLSAILGALIGLAGR